MLPRTKSGPNSGIKTRKLSSVPEFPVQLMGKWSVIYCKTNNQNPCVPTEQAINQLCLNNDGTNTCGRLGIQRQERRLLRLILLPSGSKTAA